MRASDLQTSPTRRGVAPSTTRNPLDKWTRRSRSPSMAAGKIDFMIAYTQLKLIANHSKAMEKTYLPTCHNGKVHRGLYITIPGCFEKLSLITNDGAELFNIV